MRAVQSVARISLSVRAGNALMHAASAMATQTALTRPTSTTAVSIQYLRLCWWRLSAMRSKFRALLRGRTNLDQAQKKNKKS